MLKILKFKSNVLLLLQIVFHITFADNEHCDTSYSFGDTVVKCVKVNCPIDSTEITYRNGKLASKRFYPGCGKERLFISFHENGDTLTHSRHIGKSTIGLRRIYYSANRPERFTTFDSTGCKNGWEVFWYENGNVKDSVFNVNDLVIKGTSFYQNGKPSLVEDSICDRALLKATSYNVNGKKTGVIKNGTGTVFVCDSVGGDCKKLIFKDGKRVFETVKEVPEDTALMETVMERLLANDTAFIKKMNKKDLNMLFDHSVTPLHIACDTCTIEMVKVLVGRGAKINIANGLGQSPLAVAVIKRRIDVVMFLLKHGADPNWVVSDYHSETPIYRAIESNDTAMVNLLLEYKANPHIANYDGRTPLHHAACKGDSVMLKRMLMVDNDIYHVDFDNWNALEYAKKCENAETIKILSRMGSKKK
jgi:antitoxin component YwqK of YwqJK toxin-antitoxin module